jgi:hypothetical protein
VEAAGIEPAQGFRRATGGKFPEPRNAHIMVAREAEALVPQMLEPDESTR